MALILSRLQELMGSFFEESHKCPALHLQIEAVGLDVIYQLQRSTIFVVRDVPTQLRSAAAFILGLRNKKEVAFSTQGYTE